MNRTYKSLIVLLILVFIIFGIAVFSQFSIGDYQAHMGWAKDLAEKGYIYRPPNNLFQKLVVITRVLIPFRLFTKINPYFTQVIDIKSYEIATWLLIVVAAVITAWIVYRRFKDVLDTGEENFNPWLITGLTMVAMFVEPIFLFTFPDRIYLGYITGNVYHNPTYFLLRPLAFLVFYLSIRQLHARPNWKIVLLGAALMALTIQAKPSFALTFLPALALYALSQCGEFRKLNWGYLIGALAVPTVLLLAEQYYMTYGGTESDTIILAPFEAITQHVPNAGVEILFIILSIVFPLTAMIVYWKKLRFEKTVVIAWINFGIALFFALMFSEVVHKTDLNFWWGAMVGLFILFVEMIGFSVKHGMFNFQNREQLVANVSLSVILGLHLLCGIIYYFNRVLFPTPAL